ncbi:MAG: hypothetical protein H0V24_14060 [Chloroflexia bacterium]|nr:hypothetical protein [Chloroflexia bacterium]MDQ3411745.1 hypothetical protein [Chloroflexota bacterium]
MKTIDITTLPPECVAALAAGETMQIMQDDHIAGTIEPGDPFAIVERLRELFQEVSEEELIAQTGLALRR